MILRGWMRMTEESFPGAAAGSRTVSATPRISTHPGWSAGPARVG